MPRNLSIVTLPPGCRLHVSPDTYNPKLRHGHDQQFNLLTSVLML